MIRPYGIVLEGDYTLDCRAGIHCHDWSELLGAPAKRFTDRPIPGVRGVDPGPRVAGGLTARLKFRLWGRETEAGLRLQHDLWRPNLLEHIDRLYGLLDGDDPLGVTVIENGQTYEGVLHVDDPDRPQSPLGDLATLVPVVTVAQGRLTVQTS